MRGFSAIWSMSPGAVPASRRPCGRRRSTVGSRGANGAGRARAELLGRAREIVVRGSGPDAERAAVDDDTVAVGDSAVGDSAGWNLRLSERRYGAERREGNADRDAGRWVASRSHHRTPRSWNGGFLLRANHGAPSLIVRFASGSFPTAERHVRAANPRKTARLPAIDSFALTIIPER